MGTIPASENEYPEILLTEGAAPAAPGANLVKVYAKADGLPYTKDDAGAESPMTPNAHIADTADAHDASAISIADAGTLYTATDVEAALQEVMTAVGAGGIPATILDTKGDLIAATAADTAAKMPAGTNGFPLLADSAQTTGLRYGPVAGQLIGFTRFATANTYSTSSATLADVDATNMLVTFTAPASGNVLVKLTAFADTTVGTGGQFYVWGLRESTTDLGTAMCILRAPETAGLIHTAVIYLTGISAGSHTYKWSFAISQSAAATGRLLVNVGGAGAIPPAFMEVYAA